MLKRSASATDCESESQELTGCAGLFGLSRLFARPDESDNQMNQTSRSEGARSEYPWPKAMTLRYTETVYLVHLVSLVSLVLGSEQEQDGSIA